MSSFYIASSLSNATHVKTMAAELVNIGWAWTYDWTAHGPVADRGEEVITRVALAELKGVADADVLLVILPGGRGTHTELGAALALNKPVVIYSPTPFSITHPDGYKCAFYSHPSVRIVFERDKVISTMDEIIRRGL